MSDLAVRALGLGKTYFISSSELNRAPTLRDSVSNSVKALKRRLYSREEYEARNSRSKEELHALKNISFDIHRGDVVGIIGRNGAGKSTLLKVLSQITEPTSGKVELYGRVASLLEVGTGFHPELTGRENVYLNGAILGMTRSEINSRFADIVDFAGVARFLDTPVKRYSSGMYVRLAFAIAAHVEPEILIVDEVLAVGDAEFQRKCLGRMQEVSRGDGRTVLLVSHNIGHIMSVCNKAIWLHDGEVRLAGDVDTVVAAYAQAGATNDGFREFPANDTNSPCFFHKVELIAPGGKSSSQLDVLRPFEVALDFQLRSELENLEISFRVVNSVGVSVFSSNRSRFFRGRTEAGRHRNTIQIPAETLMPGRYFLTVAAFDENGEVFDLHDQCLAFEVEETGSHMARFTQKAWEVGVVLVHFPWRDVRDG